MTARSRRACRPDVSGWDVARLHRLHFHIDIVGADLVLVAGVDGAKGEWVMAVTAAERGASVGFSVWRSFGDLWAEACGQRIAVVAVDMPIGLPDIERRTADVEARALLGPRRSSLFWTPPLCVLDADDHAEANGRSRARTDWGLSVQSFNLLPKIREVREALSAESFAPLARPRAAEVHPETSLVLLAGAPMRASKRTQSGVDERLAALEGIFPNTADVVQGPIRSSPRASLDDRLDALAAAWTARRIASGEAICLGEGEFDATGYPMHIWV